MYWKLILENLIPLVFAIIAPVVMVLVRHLVMALAKKFQIESAMTYENKIEDWVQMGIDAAEKASLNVVKTGGAKTPGQEKLQFVIDFVTAQINQHKLPQKAAKEIAKIVDARLMQAHNLKVSRAING